MNKDIQDFIQAELDESITAKQRSLEELLPKIELAAERLVACLKQGGKILTCGNGGSACDAQHFACELVNRMEFDRGAYLPAICLNSNVADLTAIGNDRGIGGVFSLPILALGGDKDVAIMITTSGNSSNILSAVDAAREKGVKIIALTGRDGGKLASVLNDDDIELRVSNAATLRTPRIQEVHILMVHILCALIDKMMFNLY